ncbi:MAG: S8 family serine peptidase [Thermoleophilia bacterium]
MGGILVLCLAAPVAGAAVIGQGGVRMGADAMWSRGVLGQGQTVAVVDQGFDGLDRSIALGELPSRDQLQIRLFDPGGAEGGVTELGLPTQHGVRMAELIHDLAPDARLVLVGYRTQEQFAQAAAWVAQQGIPVASHSNSFLTPPFDGTGPAARAVDAAAAAGVLWVNSAGNYAQRHWRGAAAPGGTVLDIAPTAGTPLLLSLAWTSPLAEGTVAIQRADGAGGWQEVARSSPAGPLNATTPVTNADGGTYRLVVTQVAGPPQIFDLFSETVGFGAAAVAEGSIPTPGDARGALTVGAVKWTGTTIEAYSSQGVPGGGKPDLVGPTYVTSNPEWPGTAGTSAATAHVAGAAVLLRQRRLALGLPAGPAELRGVLVSGALDLGAQGPDPVYGAGMARLDTAAPRLTVRVGPGPRRVVRVRAVDAGTVRQVQVTLNGRRLGTWRRPVAGVRLPAGARGRLQAIAEDMAGNVAVRARTVVAAR